MNYDVVIAGGSIAGLFCAREIANSGHSVLVLEEDYEIGTPEHCGGLVSTSGLEELGIIPRSKTFDHMIESAEVFAPNGNSFTINSKKQKVAEINRRELDKQIAHQAQKNGAEAIALTCPVCYFNLDKKQKDIADKFGDFKSIPILYFTELLGIALEVDKNIFDFSKHAVDPRPLLIEKGLIKENRESIKEETK